MEKRYMEDTISYPPCLMLGLKSSTSQHKRSEYNIYTDFCIYTTYIYIYVVYIQRFTHASLIKDYFGLLLIPTPFC